MTGINEYSLDRLSATIFSRGMEIEELEERNRCYLELIKWLVVRSKLACLDTLREGFSKDRYDEQAVNFALKHIEERLKEDKV